MPKGYWVVRLDVRDSDVYAGYIKANAEPLGRHGAKFLVRAGRHEAALAKKRSRLLIAMSGSAKVGAAAANCSLICDKRSSVTPWVAIRVKLACAAGGSATRSERSQGSAGFPSSRQERRRSLSIMAGRIPNDRSSTGRGQESRRHKSHIKVIGNGS